jgi:hypothetical protein
MDMTLTHALFIKHKTVQHVIFSNNLQNLNFQLQQASKYSLKFQPQQAIKTLQIISQNTKHISYSYLKSS